MKKSATRIGAVAYILWGLVHIAGGLAMLSVSSEGPTPFLQMLTENSSIVVPEPENSFVTLATKEVFAFHSFNIVWMGLLATVIAVRMNWKNSVTGYWMNMAIVGFADLGLIIFMVVPGVIHITDAWIGPLLFIVAIIFSTIARFARS